MTINILALKGELDGKILLLCFLSGIYQCSETSFCENWMNSTLKSKIHLTKLSVFEASSGHTSKMKNE